MNDNSKKNEPKTGCKTERFIIVEESVSAHCCFEYSVIDTNEGKESYGDYWKKIMCETFNREEAVIICDALNKFTNNY